MDMVVENFTTKNGRTPTEEEMGPLRVQAGEYAQQILAQPQAGDEDDQELEEGDEEEGDEDEGDDQEEDQDEDQDEEQGSCASQSHICTTGHHLSVSSSNSFFLSFFFLSSIEGAEGEEEAEGDVEDEEEEEGDEEQAEGEEEEEAEDDAGEEEEEGDEEPEE